MYRSLMQVYIKDSIQAIPFYQEFKECMDITVPITGPGKCPWIWNSCDMYSKGVIRR